MIDDPSVPTRRTQAERRTSAEARLLLAAAELIAEQGASRTSLAMIGERAGFSRGIVNHHFGSKAELLRRLVVKAQNSFAQHSGPPSATGLTALLQMAERYLRTMIPGNAVTRAFIVMWIESVGDDELHDTYVQGDRRFRSSVQRHVATGIEDGSIRPDVQPDAFAVSLVGQLRGIAVEALVDPKSVKRAAVIAAVSTSLSALHP